jgi:SAM-dependent methyltransferase
MSDAGLFQILESTPVYRRVKYSLNRNLVGFFAEKAFRGKRRLDVAELACGSGYGAHLLAAHPRVRRSIALDINRDLFDDRLKKDFNADYVGGDIFRLPFATDSFDLVWNSSAVEHFEKTGDAIAAMASVTKPGGYVFVGVPYRHGPLFVYHLAPTAQSREWLGKPYSLKELTALMAGAGLGCQDHIVYFFKFFVGVLARKP